MLNFLQILILALIQGACELLPVSSSAHVIVAEKLMGLNPSSPEMTMLLVMLHTGTMFAVIVYFWGGWRRDYLASRGQTQWFAILVIIATACTGVVGLGLQKVIEKIVLRGSPNAEVENLFNNPPLMVWRAGRRGRAHHHRFYLRQEKAAPHTDIQPRHSVWIGLVQGLCLPFRGFSRSGATISTGLLLGLPKQKLEEFSFALAVVLTPVVIVREAHRLLKAHALSSDSAMHLFLPGLVGMVLSFIAGLFALKLLSQWLEAGRWKFFGFYCLAAAGGVLAIHYLVK